jgi:hypothetical protein
VAQLGAGDVLRIDCRSVTCVTQVSVAQLSQRVNVAMMLHLLRSVAIGQIGSIGQIGTGGSDDLAETRVTGDARGHGCSGWNGRSGVVRVRNLGRFWVSVENFTECYPRVTCSIEIRGNLKPTMPQK